MIRIYHMNFQLKKNKTKDKAIVLMAVLGVDCKGWWFVGIEPRRLVWTGPFEEQHWTCVRARAV